MDRLAASSSPSAIVPNEQAGPMEADGPGSNALGAAALMLVQSARKEEG